MKKRIIMATVLFLSAGTLAIGATTGKIAGRVVDGATGAPLAGANVMVEGTMLGAAADDNGEYFILNVPPGQYALRTQMIGYSTVITPEVRVQIDLTTTVDFEPQVETIAGEEVIVTAERAIVQSDVSGSEININIEEVTAGLYQDVNQLITAQVGVNSVSNFEARPGIRGSDYTEALFIVDGIVQSDALTNRPHYLVNMDAVQAIKMQTGGFLARYGNLQSGVISVVTKEGGESFHGSANVQYSPPGLKHFGPMLFGHESPLGKPYVDPDAGAFTGFDSEDNEVSFGRWEGGWNGMAAGLDETAAHYNSPEELYARWLWRHRSKDSIEELKRLAGGGLAPNGKPVDITLGEGVDLDDEIWHEYGALPDYNASFTLGGPIPLLPRTTFFVSYDQSQTEYSFRNPHNSYNDYNMRGKLTTWLGGTIKLTAHGYRSRQVGADGGQGSGMTGRIEKNPFQALGSENKTWYTNCMVSGEAIRSIYGVNLLHTLSPSTFYEVKYAYHSSEYDEFSDWRETAPKTGTSNIRAGRNGEILEFGQTTSDGNGVNEGLLGTTEYAQARADAGVEGWENWRNWARIQIGEYWYDESPRGYGTINWKDETGDYRMESCNIRNQDTYTKSHEFQASLISQINVNNQVEIGANFRSDLINMSYEAIDPSVNGGSYNRSEGTMLTGGLYAMDKLEFKGFIANLGLRMDWIKHADFPVINWDDLSDVSASGPFSTYLLKNETLNDPSIPYYDPLNDYNTYDNIPLQSISKVRFSPRLGVSHPISDVAKIFFNYGHMYQWPDPYRTYRIQYRTREGSLVEDYGNPKLDPPRTIQYELGYEHNLFNMMSLRLTSYYKDITFGREEIDFRPIAHGKRHIDVQWNGAFSDIRGLEAYLELRRGVVPFVSGWASVNYMVKSGGKYGYDDYYEDPSKQPNPQSSKVSKPDVRPIVKANIDFHTPANFGPTFAGFSPLGGADMSLLYTWQRGGAFTYNPAGLPDVLVEDNLRWKAFQQTNLRFSKDLLTAGSFRSVFYVDVTNLFNNKNMTHWKGNLGDGGSSQGNSGAANTDDQWAWSGHKWWSNEEKRYLEAMGYTPDNMNDDGTFSNTTGTPGDDIGSVEDGMPHFTPWTFLGLRDIFVGIRIYF